MIDATDTIDRARRLLGEPVPVVARAAPTLAAALLAAVAAVMMAGVVILGPTIEISEPAEAIWPTA